MSASIDAKRGQSERAIETLQAAIKLEDALQYDEPPAWYFAAAASAGHAAVGAKRPADAEAVYRDDLKRNPENGWSLARPGPRSMPQGRGRRGPRRFAKAWARADYKLD